MSASPHDLGDAFIERVRERDVSDYSSIEERPWPEALGAVDHLVWDNEIPRLDLLLQAPNGREGDDGTDTNRTQGSNIGASRNLVGCELMVQAMSTQERYRDNLAIVSALVVKNRNRRRGISPRSRDRQRSDLGETGKFPKSSATDDSNTDGICWQIGY